MRHAASLIALALLAGLTACGGAGTEPGTGGNTGNTGGNPPATPPSTSTSITVANNSFDPASTTVGVGVLVTWTWNACTSDGYGGTVCTRHNVTFPDGAHSDTQTEGSWSRSFGTAGTYRYECTIHGAAMSGTVVVR
jgi:plastocyanin